MIMNKLVYEDAVTYQIIPNKNQNIIMGKSSFHIFQNLDFHHLHHT